MGSVHDEEPDCCKSSMCLCKPFSDNICFNNLLCNKLRLNGTSRIAFGAFLGFILGLVISSVCPQAPPTNQCIDADGYSFKKKLGLSCNHFWSLTNETQALLQDRAFERSWELCLVQSGSHFMRRTGEPCSLNGIAYPSRPLVIDYSTDTRVCYDSTPGAPIYATFDDDDKCSKWDNLKVLKTNFDTPIRSEIDYESALTGDTVLAGTKRRYQSLLTTEYTESNNDGTSHSFVLEVFKLSTNEFLHNWRSDTKQNEAASIIKPARPAYIRKNLATHPDTMPFCLSSTQQNIKSSDGTCVGDAKLVIGNAQTIDGGDAATEQYKEDKDSYLEVIDYLFNFTGGIWMRGLKLIVMPLLVANIITSVAQLRETSSEGSIKLAWMTALYYVTTTICAAIESLILVSVMLIPFMKEITDIDDLHDPKLPATVYQDTGEQLTGVIESMIPKNIVKATGENNYLGIIFFSIVIGCVVGLDSTFLKFFADLNTMMLRMVRVLVLWTPLGVFLLVTYSIAFHDLVHLLSNVGLFLATVMVGLLIHLLCVYPTIYFCLTRKNPATFLWNIIPAAVTALSISSSIATYPYTLNCAVNRNKLNDKISKFVLTLGATINMDGTTIGFPIAVVFVAYAQGYTLGFGQRVLIVILSTVSSMGAAPIPQAGLVLLILIIESLKIPLGPVFSLILAVDWLYDRPETMVNICGDSFAAGIMHHYLHKSFENTQQNTASDAQSKSS